MQVSNFDTIPFRVAADVANAANFSVPLPAGRTMGNYLGDHRLGIPSFGGEQYSYYDGKINISYGATSATVVNNTGRTIPAGTQVYLQLERHGANGEYAPELPNRCRWASIVMVDLGSPAALAAAGLAASQSVTAASATGAVLLKTQLDVPRNVTAAWTGAAVCTVRGKDEFGQAMTESSASGTALTGKKAFSVIDSIKVSANVTLFTAGWGNLLGLPIYIGQPSDFMRVIVSPNLQWTDSQSLMVAGIAQAATATNGDVRGTFSITAQAPDGAKGMMLQINAFDINYRGVKQFAG